MIYESKSPKSNVPTNETLTFREAYNSCFANGVATSESTSIHIARAITSLTAVAHMYRALTISVEVTMTNGEDNISKLCHKYFPFGFYSHNLFMGFDHEVCENSYPDLVMDVNLGESNRQQTTFIIRHLNTPVVKEFIAELRKLEFKPPIKVSIIRSIGNDGSINRESIKYRMGEHFEAHVDFYPFLREQYPEVSDDEFSIDYIVQDFMNSKANLLLMIGNPGTGKSTLNRAFLRPEYEILMVNSAQVLENPALPNTFRSEPEDESKKMLTLYEDADIFVSPRSKGNLALSSMLNHLDGIIASKEKYIISTNLESLSMIDAALRRPGRCHKVFCFGNLEGEQINIARAAVGKPPIDVKRPMTLSEALNYDSVDIESRRVKGIGFTS